MKIQKNILLIIMLFFFFSCLNSVIATSQKIKLTIQPDETERNDVLFSYLGENFNINDKKIRKHNHRYSVNITQESLYKVRNPYPKHEKTPQEIIQLIASYVDYNERFHKFELDPETVAVFMSLIFKQKPLDKNIPQNSNKTAFYLGILILEELFKSTPGTHVLYQTYNEQPINLTKLSYQEYNDLKKSVYHFQSILGIPLIRDNEHIFSYILNNNEPLSDQKLNELDCMRLIREISPNDEQGINWQKLTYLEEKTAVFLQQQMDELSDELLPYKDQLKTRLGKYVACLMQIDKNNFLKENNDFDANRHVLPHNSLFNFVIKRLYFKQKYVFVAVEKTIETIFSKNFLHGDERNQIEKEEMKHFLMFYKLFESSLTPKVITQLLTNTQIPISAECLIYILSSFKKIFKNGKINMTEEDKNALSQQDFIVQIIYPDFSIYNLLEIINKGFIEKEKDQKKINIFLDFVTANMYITRKVKKVPLEILKRLHFSFLSILVKDLFKKKNRTNRKNFNPQNVLKELTILYGQAMNNSHSSVCSKHNNSRVYTHSVCYTWLCCFVKGLICKLCIESQQKCTCIWESPLKRSSIKYKKESEEPNGCSNTLCYFSFCCCLLEKCCLTEHLYKAICKNPLCLTSCLTHCTQNNDENSCLKKCAQDLDETDCLSMVCCGKYTVRCCDDACVIVCNSALQCCNAKKFSICFLYSCYMMTWQCRNWSLCNTKNKKAPNLCTPCIFCAKCCCPYKIESYCSQENWNMPCKCKGTDATNIFDSCCLDIISPPNYILPLQAKVVYRLPPFQGVSRPNEGFDEPIMLTTREYHEQKNSDFFKENIDKIIIKNPQSKCCNSCVIL